MSSGRLVVVAAALAGCGMGVGSMSAASRPVAGRQTVVDDLVIDATCTSQLVSTRFEWYQTIETYSEVCLDDPLIEHLSGATKLTHRVSMGGGWRHGRGSSTLMGAAPTSTNIDEIDITILGHLPVPRFGLAAGVTYLTGFEGDVFYTAPGLRASLALIPQLAIDASWAHASGYHSDEVANRTDISGSRTSLGGTLMLYGLGSTRLAVSVAYTRLDGDNYKSSGYTYQLAYTLW